MIRKTCDVVIVGSGFAGLSAADILAERGLRVLLLDENLHLGGQLLRSPPWSGKRSSAGGIMGYGFRLIGRIKSQPIEVLNRTNVLDIDERGMLLVEREERMISVASKMLLLATGARERFMPFKGWTLPGVISTGAAQILMKSYGVLPSKRMLIAGIGPLLLAVAGEFLKNGGRLLSVLDMGGAREKFLLLTRGIQQFSKVTEGIVESAQVFLARVPYHLRTMVVEARGGPGLSAVVAAKIGKDGSLLKGTEMIYRTDSLALGHGFVPNIELAQLAGCAIDHDGGKGGWVVRVGEDLQTSEDRVFAAGEITGIGGALKSMDEGRLAAFGILNKLGREVDPKRLIHLKRQRNRHLRFGILFNNLHRMPDQAFLSIPGEVTICRCEDVKMADVTRAVKDGYDTPAALKRALRIGMGNCQGRICAPLVYDILSALKKTTAKEFPPFSVRSPVKPVAIRSFLS